MQRNENHESIGTDGSCTPFPVTFAAAATTAGSADFDFDLVAFGKSLEFYKQGFSGKSLAAISAIRNQTTFSRRRNCPGPSVATKTVVAALAARRSIAFLAGLQGRGPTSPAAAATTCAEEIQAFQAEGTAAAATAAGGACDDGKTSRSGPRPLEIS